METARKFKVAVAQAAPVFMDKTATIEKTIAIMRDAARQGARLIVFPECWVPGYPWWIWLDAPARGVSFVPRYHDNALSASGPEIARIGDVARELGLHVVLGYVEKHNGTLYIAQAIIDDAGALVASRRKLRPTHAERTVFGEGDGSDLRVFDTALGRLGAFSCAENLQPLSKYAMYAQNEQIHASSWPSFCLYRGKSFQLGAEANTAAAQVYALEGACFVLASCSVVSREMIDTLIDRPEKADLLVEGGGYSMIYGPDSAPLCAFLDEREEGILYADIDLSAISVAKAAFDPAGHYSRPDVVKLLLNDQPLQRVEHVDPSMAASPPDRTTREGMRREDRDREG